MFDSSHSDVHNRLKSIAECGKKTSQLLFHIVLYQALLWELLKTPGAWVGNWVAASTTGASSSSADAVEQVEIELQYLMDDELIMLDFECMNE